MSQAETEIWKWGEGREETKDVFYAFIGTYKMKKERHFKNILFFSKAII